MAGRPTHGHYLGHDKELPQPHGPKQRGRPPVHSHSARPKRAIKTGGKRGMKGSI